MDHLLGIFTLPGHFTAKKDLLGKKVTVPLDEHHADLHFPRLSSDGSGLEAPELDLSSYYEEFPTATVPPWGYASHRKEIAGTSNPTAWHIQHAAIEIRLQPSPDNTDSIFARIWEFGHRLNKLYRRVLEWHDILVGGQGLLDEPWEVATQATLVDLGAPQGARGTGWTPHGERLVITRAESAFDYNCLIDALDRASAGSDIPLEWNIFLQARRSSLDRRVAVVHVATAAEVAIARALRDRLSSISSSTAIDLIIKQTQGVAGQLKLLEELDESDPNVRSPDKSIRNRVIHQLAEPRNLAVHQGVTPVDDDTVQKAFQTALDVLKRYSPIEDKATSSS